MNDQTIPHDHDAEMGIIGAMCMFPDKCIDELADILYNGEPFYDVELQKLYRHLRALNDMCQPIDMVVLCADMKSEAPCGVGNGDWQELVIDCAQSVSYWGNSISWAKIVVAHYLRRIIITESATMRALSGEMQGDPLEHFDSWSKRCDERMKKWEHREDNLGVAHTLMSNEDDDVRIPYHTGVHEIDSVFGGFAKGSLTVIAARTSVGKTSLALTCHYRMTKIAGHSSLFVSIEMGKAQVGARMMSQDAGIPTTDILNGRTQLVILADIRQTIENQAWADRCRFIYDRHKCESICAAIRTSIRRFGTEIVFVDYLQMMDCDTERGENRERQVAKMTKMLKNLANHYEVAVVLVAQLNRCPDKRTDQRPRLSDLRESGAIEQDADAVLFLYHQEGSLAGVQFKIAKNRNGSTTGWRGISFDEPTMVFGSCVPRETVNNGALFEETEYGR